MSYCFISFSTKDQVFADKVLNELENKYKIKCFICYRDMLGGLPYAEQLDDAIKNCACIALLHSNNSDASEHVKREIELASKYNKAIVPCKLDSAIVNGELGYTLNRVHWLDFTEFKDSDLENLAKSIINIVGSPYKKAIVRLHDILRVVSEFGATPELLQDIVFALYDCIKNNWGNDKRKLERLYNSYVKELQNIINNYGGDVANHHDELLQIMNEIVDFCRKTLA